MQHKEREQKLRGDALARLRASENVVLTAEEEEWLRRGRNAAARGPSRVKPAVYRDASALECLLGWLHLTDPERLGQVVDCVFAAGCDDEREAASEEAS